MTIRWPVHFHETWMAALTTCGAYAGAMDSRVLTRKRDEVTCAECRRVLDAAQPKPEGDDK
jgi:hypothetical protein